MFKCKNYKKSDFLILRINKHLIYIYKEIKIMMV